jgi:hypothetical protein
MIEPRRPTRAKKTPITEPKIETAPIASGYRTRSVFGKAVASSITATAVTA